ncbi:MAG: hypothetical protein WCL38_01910 [Actinomycetota bacterium]
MGLPGMVLSAIAAVVGAIMYWGVATQTYTQNHGIRVSTIGVILMVAGGVGFLASAIVYATSQRSPSSPNQTLDRSTRDETGATTEVHETRS